MITPLLLFHLSLPLSLFPQPPSAGAFSPAANIANRAQVSQFGITWQFDRPMLTGQFVNGDWWVVGRTAITRITPGSILEANGRHRNGSMINPSPELGVVQGYDSEMYAQYSTPGSFDPHLDVGSNVSALSPLWVDTGSSLVSTVSNPTPGARPQLLTAAILTVLPVAPPADAFRPPYSDRDKTIYHRESDLQWHFLKRLPKVSSTPALATVERYFERPWLDHTPTWIGRYVHPRDNMPDYGRDMTDRIGIASLMLNLDFTQAQKRTLLIRLVQLGIDFNGVLRTNGGLNWQAGGGHHSGRKWPILFAGFMLYDSGMASIGFDPSVLFMGEDGQTFYVEETSPGVYNQGYGGYGPQHVGMAEWGQKHALDPSLDDVDWFADPYRTCCTGNCWTGQVLAVRIMAGQVFWNHDALFDYQDRYVATQKQNGGSVATNRFAIDMWNAYRSSY